MLILRGRICVFQRLWIWHLKESVLESLMTLAGALLQADSATVQCVPIDQS